MAINSAQGIASLFRGNPQPLQQSIQKDQQAKPGLPPDLQKMLALQIVTNEDDAFKRSEAAKALLSMSGGQGGKPPTVMQSLQQQADQKTKALATQAQQKQQAMQGMAQAATSTQVPKGVEFAEAQPKAQGIDQLPVEFEGAEGGIVAFQNRGEVPEAELASDSMGGFTPDPEREALNALRIEEKYAEENRQKRIAELRKKAEFLEKAGAPQADAVRAQIELEERKAPKLRPRPAQPEKGLPSATQQVVAPPAQKKVIPRPPRPAPIADIAQLATQMQGSQKQTAPAGDSAAMGIVKQRMNLDPDVEEAKATAKFKAAVPAEDLSQHDRMIAELENRKKQLEGPQDKFGQLMEYLGQISANSRPGQSSGASGAAGARALDALKRDRQTQQFDLSKQAIEISQKKLDSVRNYAKETYNVGKSKFDEVYREKLLAAKDVVSSETEASKLAKQETLKYFELAQNQMLEQQRIRAQAAGRPFDVQGEYAKAMLAGDKERAKTLQQILSTVGEAKRPGADTAQVAKFKDSNAQLMVTLQLLQAKEMKKTLKPAEQEELRRLEGKLSGSARAQGIDPAQLGIGSATLASSGGLDLSQWGDLKKN